MKHKTDIFYCTKTENMIVHNFGQPSGNYSVMVQEMKRSFVFYFFIFKIRHEEGGYSKDYV